MLIGPNTGAFNITLIRGRPIIISEYLKGLWKLGFVIEYEDRLTEFKFYQVCNIRCKTAISLVQVTPIQRAVIHAVENRNGICNTE